MVWENRRWGDEADQLRAKLRYQESLRRLGVAGMFLPETPTGYILGRKHLTVARKQHMRTTIRCHLQTQATQDPVTQASREKQEYG